MDVDLAQPELVSLDTAMALAGVALAGWGGYQLFTKVGAVGGVEGWALLAVGWLVLFPQLFLKLRMEPEALSIKTVTGTRQIPYEDVTGARLVDGRLIVRWKGASAAGYHVGAFHLDGEGRVEAYASRAKGPFVLLERAADPPVVVSPADPEGFLEASTGDPHRGSKAESSVA